MFQNVLLKSPNSTCNGVFFIVTHGTCELKFNLHKKCTLRLRCYLNALYTFNLDLISTGEITVYII